MEIFESNVDLKNKQRHFRVIHHALVFSSRTRTLRKNQRNNENCWTCLDFYVELQWAGCTRFYFFFWFEKINCSVAIKIFRKDHQLMVSARNMIRKRIDLKWSKKNASVLVVMRKKCNLNNKLVKLSIENSITAVIRFFP